MSMLDHVPGEAKCRATIRRCLFGARAYCPHCLFSNPRACEGRYFCPRCRRKFSLTSCSWLRGMRIPYRTLFVLIVLWQRRAPFGLAAELAGVSAPTARRWFGLFRANLPPNLAEFSGFAEVDESYFGRRRNGSQSLVIGCVGRRSYEVALRVIPARSYEHTDAFILDRIAPGSCVFTDGAGCYEGISGFFGYRHVACNHSKFEFGPTNRIESVWSSLKRFLVRTLGRPTAKRLPEMLREYETRRNLPELFDSPPAFLHSCLTLVPRALQ